MGIATADSSGDGRPDLLVTNSHKQLHAVFRSGPPAGVQPTFTGARSDIATAFDTGLGLGTAKTVQKLIVRYPGGRETRLGGVAANQVRAVGD